MRRSQCLVSTKNFFFRIKGLAIARPFFFARLRHEDGHG